MGGSPPGPTCTPLTTAGVVGWGHGARSHPAPLAPAALPQVLCYHHQASGAATPPRPHLRLHLLLAAAWRDF